MARRKTGGERNLGGYIHTRAAVGAIWAEGSTTMKQMDVMSADELVQFAACLRQRKQEIEEVQR